MDSNQYLDDNAQPAAAADTPTPAASPYSFHPSYTPPATAPATTTPPESVASTPPLEPPAAVNVPVNQPAEEKPELTTPPAEPELTTPPAEPELTTPAPEPKIPAPPAAPEISVPSSSSPAASDDDAKSIPEESLSTKQVLEYSDVINKDILELLQAPPNLSEEDKQEIYIKLYKVIEDRVIARIHDQLSEQEVDEWSKFVESGNRQGAQNYLKSKGLELPTLIVEEAIILKTEVADLFKKAQGEKK